MGFCSMPTIRLMLCLLVLMCSKLAQGKVEYDGRALIINGKRRILFSGAMHYPRSTPEMWEDLIKKAKEGGLQVIETYVFWNGHEKNSGVYTFDGRYDIVRFLKTVQKAGLYAHLRIGPYICAEWNFGGFPVWLKSVPGISFRTDNAPFKAAMKSFVRKIVGLMKSEKLFEPQGGPIILSQIENEYENLETIYGADGYNYMNWAANMAVQLKTGVPWVMCKQNDAPDPVINTCNGFFCDKFNANKFGKPKIWTEAYTGWFTEFGEAKKTRSASDLAYAVARFIQNGGSFINYYMYHGGTNFGRTAGGPFITTSYDYDAPIDEYGLLRQPKHGHLKELHKSIKMCEPALVSANPIVTSLGASQQAHVYSSENGMCAAFLSNYDTQFPARVMFNNMHYNLPASSVSILPDCRNVVFNTAKVGVQTSKVDMLPSVGQMLSWETYNEDISALDDGAAFTATGLLEQINVTKDVSDYLWYKTSVDVSPSELSINGPKFPTLVVLSAGHALHAFVNGIRIASLSGERENKRFTLKAEVTNLHAGANRIELLSVVVGLPNMGRHFESWNTGLALVALHGLGQGNLDLTWQKWTYQVGMKGEVMDLASPDGLSSVDWAQDSLAVQRAQPLTWFKTRFDAPQGDNPLALDMASMGKGQAWVNGQSIGRYWPVIATGDCNCTIDHTLKKCQTGCGAPTQRWYHVPRSWLKPTDNLLVLFEEVGGNPNGISLVERSVTRVCADVSEYHPTLKNWQIESYGKAEGLHTPKAHLTCSNSQVISSIKFASFGTPVGTCSESFTQGPCHAAGSTSIIRKQCIGKQKCSMAISNSKFGTDPCPKMLKRLAVEVVCSPK